MVRWTEVSNARCSGRANTAVAGQIFLDVLVGVGAPEKKFEGQAGQATDSGATVAGPEPCDDDQPPNACVPH